MRRRVGVRAKLELCESGGGRAGLPIPILVSKRKRKKTVDIKQHLKKRKKGAGQNSGAVWK